MISTSLSYFFSIFFGTFALEDVALAAAITLYGQGKLPLTSAFMAAFLGIAIGDVGLYLIGRLFAQFPQVKEWALFNKIKAAISRSLSLESLSYSIVMSRFIPGTRLPTYVWSGLSGFSFFRFVYLTIFSVFAWVLLAFVFGKSIQSFISENWIISLLILLLVFHLMKSIIPRLSQKWDRLALFNSWRKWTHFEFWPAWFFYIPFYFYYAFLSIRYRSLLTPFYANPEVYNGGILGESKWDFLKHLSLKNPTTLRTLLVRKETDADAFLKLIQENGFSFPLILKPDIGQRGFGVRIIRDEDSVREYLLACDFDLIVQELSRFSEEAGLFYIRKPSEANGILYSITDKKFPMVVGDGKSPLGDLIARDLRARNMLSTYYERLKERLDEIIASGDVVALSECGNHCQGAIFENGIALKTAELEKAVDEIAIQIPHFYFGRLDVRYKSTEDLMAGKNFEIVEINGAGAEATHIWDNSTRLLEAYSSLFHQWSILFAIGNELKHRKDIRHQLHIWAFLKESFSVYFRSSKLSRSS